MENNKTLASGIIFFFLVSIFMLVNGAYFNTMFRGTPLIIWRQLIWVIGLAVSFYYLKYYTVNSLVRIFKVELYFFYALLLLSLITIALHNFNIIRISYAFWIYFSGLPFVCLPSIIQQSKLMQSQTFYSIFTYIGLFISIGLFLDYKSGGLYTTRYLGATMDIDALQGLLTNGRYCFLSEAPTTFGVFYAFCMLCGLMRMHQARNFFTRFLFLIISGSYIFGSWYTGSRQIVVVLVLMYILGIIIYLTRTKGSKAHIFVGGIIACVYVPTLFYSVMMSEPSYTTRFSTSNLEDDKRSDSWVRGFKETVLDDATITLFGKAVALCQGQKAAPSEITGSHYENSFFARLSECGIVGLALLIYPVYYMIRRLGKWDIFQFLILMILCSYLIISYVSPNGQHQTSQLAIYLTLGLYVARQFFDPEFS